MYLIGKDLWELVTGAETLGENATAEATQKFKKRDNQALACVCLSVATNLQIYVRSAKNAKEAWESLENHFEEKSLAKKIFYRRKLYSARMEKGTNMVSHINYVKTLSEHLEAIDDRITEKDLVIILISSLPEEYNNLITALETIAEEKLTWNYVRDRLINEFDKFQGGSAQAVNDEAKDYKNKGNLTSRNSSVTTARKRGILQRIALKRELIRKSHHPLSSQIKSREFKQLRCKTRKLL